MSAGMDSSRAGTALRSWRRPAWLGLLVLCGGSCTELIDSPTRGGSLEFDPDRPSLGEATEAERYTGDDPSVLEAQELLRTGLDLHAQVIFRTCGPNGGVCHNAAEYPDLHTPASFMAAIGAPCNVQSGTPEAVYDRCERPGDRFKLGGTPEVEIGYVDYIPGRYDREADGEPDADTPGLHIYVADPVGEPEGRRPNGQFIRTFVHEGRVQDLPYFSLETRWRVLDGGHHIHGTVENNRADQVQELMTVGVIEGDANRNGVFGARQGEPITMLEPGRPEASYLIARLRGFMQGESIPGSRMPLANQPLSVPEMLGLFCFVEGLTFGQEANLEAEIDYASCSYSVDPESLNLLGSGVTWERRVRHILEFNCGGCHSGTDAQGQLNLVGDDVYARLLEPSGQVPEMRLVEPGAPDESYLWLKLTGDPRSLGLKMPFNPLTGAGELRPAELDDIRAWIEAGAVENE